MTFSDFANKLFSVISAGGSTSTFTRSLFEAIVTEDGLKILNEYSSSSFKGFYNGNTQITRIAKKINAYIEPMNFEQYISQFSDPAIEILCSVFTEALPEIGSYNAGEQLSELFVAILTEAAGANKKSTQKSAENNADRPTAIIMDSRTVAPDLATYKDGILYLDKGLKDNDEVPNPFDVFLKKAIDYYSAKKTLLYAEKPHPFYEIYVCNNLHYHKVKINGARDPRPEITISDATAAKLEQESKYIIIEGTGGIGKSMFLTHLFLSAAVEYESSEELPVLVTLKDYRENTVSIVQFIWASINAFDSNVTQKQVIEALENKRLLLLMDGLDEIQSALRENFNTDLEAFIKSYPGNTVIITSRPVNAFVSYSRFSLFDIEPLNKEQALALIRKLDYWDASAKASFMASLDKGLYYSHYQFASNPLLLTIMLMTYSAFGEVPAKMHVFYSKAYETMARLHDATKGSYKRPLHTKLTPEEFAKYFSQFCARTYTEEVMEFNDRTFASYMNKVLKGSLAKENGVTPRDFLLDLADNLCIMYHEGDTYYFIHRSFQEYFAAVYFASDYDAKLSRVGSFFEKAKNRSYSDRTFDMLYDMIPEKVERYIFLPFLEKLISICQNSKEKDDYWEFLEQQYPAIYYEEGNVGDLYLNAPQSFIYEKILRGKHLGSATDIDNLIWPAQLYDLPRRNWVTAYKNFLELESFERNPNPDLISENDLEETTDVPEDELPYQYYNYFGDPDVVGFTIEIEIYELRKNSPKYQHIRKFMEDDQFPFVEEYRNVKKYYSELKARTEKEYDSEDLFDD